MTFYSKIFQKTIWPIWENKNHFDILHQIDELRSLEYDRERIQNRQECFLSRILLYASTHVPYYKNLFKTPGDITLEGLHQIPPLTPSHLQKYTDSLMSRVDDLMPVFAPDGSWRWSVSSGSTGEPKRFRINNYALSFATASMYRCWSWINDWQLGERYVNMKFTGKKTKFVKRLKNRLFNVLWMPALDLDEKTCAKYVKTIRKKKPKLLRAYSSGVFLLSEYINNHEINDIQIPNVQTHGETLFPHWRKSIEEAFQTTAADGYGAESFHIAHQCEEGNYHIDENMIVEVINGELYITSLLNFIQPFIRYKIGDSAIVNHSNCPCGRGHDLLVEIEGRLTDIIKLKDGRHLVPPAFAVLFEHSKSFIQFQILQPKYDQIEFKLIKSPQFNTDEYHKLRSTILSLIGHDVEISYEIVDEIPVSPSGKRRFIISEVE